MQTVEKKKKKLFSVISFEKFLIFPKLDLLRKCSMFRPSTPLKLLVTT